MRHINWRAVILGSAVTFTLDLLVGLLILQLFIREAVQPGMTDAEASAAMIARSLEMTPLLASFLLGSLTTIIGGYIAAMMARRLPYMNAAAVGVVGVIQGMLLFNGQGPVWVTVLGLLVNVPMALVGGRFAKRRLQGGSRG